MSKKLFLVICLCLLPLIAGCFGRAAEDFFHPFSLEQRQMQTRVFKTQDETKVLAVCAALLQDNGFQVDEAESSLGLLASSKFKVVRGKMHMVSANVITHSVQGSLDTMAVRVTFYHSVTGYLDTPGPAIVQRRPAIVKEPVIALDPVVYQEFFARLAKALFLEAQQI